MNTKAQRIAIAEACGWKETHIMQMGAKGKYVRTYQKGRGKLHQHLPDYLNDLNAMHEAVKSFFCSKPARDGWMYLENLQHVAGICHSSICLRLVEATPAQRAEAFLRTINKWTTN